MKAAVYSQKGTKLKSDISVVDGLFDQEPNHNLIAQYVYVYNSNQREAIAHAKDRSEVRGGGAKPWRQKGTGRARSGSNRSPIWTGGGVTFGPTNVRNWKRSMSKKMRRASLRSALSLKYAEDQVKFLDKVDFGEARTATAIEFAKAFKNPRKFTLVVAPGNKEAQKAFANLKNANVVSVEELNTYDVVNAGELFIDKSTLDYMEVWAKPATENKKDTKK